VTEIADFGLVIAVSAGVFALAVLSNKLSERFAVPAPAIFLLATALAGRVFTRLGDELSIRDVERIAVVALIAILFDGGMRVGWNRFRASLVPVASLGVLGTFATAAGSLAAAIPQMLVAAGLDEIGAIRLMFFGYAALGLDAVLLYAQIPPHAASATGGFLQ